MEDQVAKATEFIDVMLSNFRAPKNHVDLADELTKQLINTFKVSPEVATAAVTKYFGVTVQ